MSCTKGQTEQVLIDTLRSCWSCVLISCSFALLLLLLSRLLLCGRRSQSAAPGQTCADRWRRQLCVLVVLVVLLPFCVALSLSLARVLRSSADGTCCHCSIAFDDSVIVFLYKKGNQPKIIYQNSRLFSATLVLRKLWTVREKKPRRPQLAASATSVVIDVVVECVLSECVSVLTLAFITLCLASSCLFAFLQRKKRKIKQKKINRNRNFLFFGFDFFSFFGYAASFRLLTFYCATLLPHAACRMHVCISVSMSASVSSTLAASVRYYDWAALCAASSQATKNNNNKKVENQNKCSFCCWCCRSWLPSRRFGVDCAALVCLDSPLPFMRERKIRFK